MPTPTQERIKRISELAEWAKGRSITTIDEIYHEAQKRYPYVNKSTLLNYSESALRILKSVEV